MRFAPILLALVTLISTGLGGTAAIRLRDRLHLLLGFSSGAVLAVALFDILPEVFAFDHGASYMPITALGFLAFFGLERYTAMHRAREHPQWSALMRRSLARCRRPVSPFTAFWTASQSASAFR